MTAYASLSALMRAMIALLAVLLCLANISSAVIAAQKKVYRYLIFAALLFAPVYFLWQIIFDISLFGTRDSAADISLIFGSLPWIAWVAAFVLLTVLSVLLLRRCLRYDKATITPSAIKLFLDQLPCGVCCWQSNGRVLFSNVCMNRLCIALTNSPLLNGNQFRYAVTDEILTLEGRVWRFSTREINLDGIPVHEMVASDITTEYAETQALEAEKKELSALNSQLQEYYRSIDETVHRQEILNAKMNIHDEMNRLMLSTTATNAEDDAALNHIFSLWEQNALLLCMEAEEAVKDKAADSLGQLATALKLRLCWQNPLPASLSEQQRTLLYSAAKEAIINAVKHAGASTMTITFDEAQFTCSFTSDGNPPTGDVHFTGGLANLATLASKQGATLSAEVGENFTLILHFPKNQPIG